MQSSKESWTLLTEHDQLVSAEPTQHPDGIHVLFETMHMVTRDEADVKREMRQAERRQRSMASDGTQRVYLTKKRAPPCLLVGRTDGRRQAEPYPNT